MAQLQTRTTRAGDEDGRGYDLVWARQAFPGSRWLIKLGLDVVLWVVRDAGVGGGGDGDGDGLAAMVMGLPRWWIVMVEDGALTMANGSRAKGDGESDGDESARVTMANGVDGVKRAEAMAMAMVLMYCSG